MTDLVNDNQNSIELILSEDKLNDNEYINNKLLEVKLSVLHQLSRGNTEKFKNLIVEHAYDLLCLERMKIEKINSLLKEFKITYNDFSQNDKDKYLTVYKEFMELSKNNPMKAEDYSEKSQVYLSLQNDKLNSVEVPKEVPKVNDVSEKTKTKNNDKVKKKIVKKKKKIKVKKKKNEKKEDNDNEEDKDYLDQIKKNLEI